MRKHVCRPMLAVVLAALGLAAAGCAGAYKVNQTQVYVQFNTQDLVATFRRKVQKATNISRSGANAFIADYIGGLAGYTYLEGD